MDLNAGEVYQKALNFRTQNLAKRRSLPAFSHPDDSARRKIRALEPRRQSTVVRLHGRPVATTSRWLSVLNGREPGLDAPGPYVAGASGHAWPRDSLPSDIMLGATP